MSLGLVPKRGLTSTRMASFDFQTGGALLEVVVPAAEGLDRPREGSLPFQKGSNPERETMLV